MPAEYNVGLPWDDRLGIASVDGRKLTEDEAKHTAYSYEDWGDTHQLYRCPSDPKKWDWAGRSVRSYTANQGHWNNGANSHGWVFPGYNAESAGAWSLKFTDINDPATGISIFETDDIGANNDPNVKPWKWVGGQGALTKPKDIYDDMMTDIGDYSNKHGKFLKMNYLFIDGRGVSLPRCNCN